MAIPFDTAPSPRDPRASHILAKSIYRELASSGYGPGDVVAVASALLALVTEDVRAKKSDPPPG